MADRPNVILIVSDTFRRDHLGLYGNAEIHTPHLDAFAAESAVFDHHLVSSFATMPARADILTGSFAYTFMGWEPLPPTLQTLPAALSEAGYITMGIADTPFFVRNGFGYDRGFQDFIWVRGQGDSLNPHERNDSRATWTCEEDRFAPRTIREAENWLERHYKERFFLYVDLWDPHEPWDAPDYYTAAYMTEYGGEQVYPPYARWRDAGMTQHDVRVAHATYCGEVTMVDRWIGRLLTKIDVLGLRRNTIVIFVSDHGFYFGEHGYLGKAEWVEEYRGDKHPYSVYRWSPLYQEITRIPLIVRRPAQAPRREAALTTAPDLAPTILRLVDIDPPATMGGKAFDHVLNGRATEHRAFVISSWPLSFSEGTVTQSIDSRPREIANYMPLTVTTREASLLIGGPDDPPELYDIPRDPTETQNLWHRDNEVGTTLFRGAVAFLEGLGTDDQHVAPRRAALKHFAPDAADS